MHGHSKKLCLKVENLLKPISKPVLPMLTVHLFLPLFNNNAFSLYRRQKFLWPVYYHDIVPSEAKTSKALNIGPNGNTSVAVEKALNYSNDYQILTNKCFLILQFQKKLKENLSCELIIIKTKFTLNNYTLFAIWHRISKNWVTMTELPLPSIY